MVQAPTELQRRATAMRLSRHLAFRRRLQPERFTRSGDLETACARIRAAIRRRDEAQIT
jgi:hypothetical protein